MSDLDLGMNEWTTSPLTIDESKDWDRGKVLDAEELDNVEKFGRYLDVDGDGYLIELTQALIPRKEPFYSGNSHNEYAGYTEDGSVNVRVMERLLKKFSTAKTLVPRQLLVSRLNRLPWGWFIWDYGHCYT